MIKERIVLSVKAALSLNDEGNCCCVALFLLTMKINPINSIS